MHKTMASVASVEKIKIIRSQEFMRSEARLKFLKKMIILGPKTAILGPQFCRILVLGPLLRPCWYSAGTFYSSHTHYIHLGILQHKQMLMHQSNVGQ